MELKLSLTYFLTLVCLTAGLMNTKYTTHTSCLNSTHESPDTSAMVLCVTPAISYWNRLDFFIQSTAVISCDFNTPKHRLAFHPKDRNMHC